MDMQHTDRDLLYYLIKFGKEKGDWEIDLKISFPCDIAELHFFINIIL